MRRLRGGELLALGGAVLLLVALFLPWFRLELRLSVGVGGGGSGVDEIDVSLPDVVGPSASGWNSLGWLVLAVAAAAIAAVAWLAIANVVGRPVAHTVAANVIAAVLGLIALVVLALRALIFQPGPNDLVGLRYGAWLGLAGALAMTIGAWWALADERTGASESAFGPPPARPAPPERAS